MSRIALFSLRGPRAVCILSATGAVSSVIIRQPGSSGGILRFEVPSHLISSHTLIFSVCLLGSNFTLWLK